MHRLHLLVRQVVEAAHTLGEHEVVPHMLDAAETALRKAVQIKPGYSEAHHNLAVVYATQNPPFIALAKFHYEKALAAGYKKNADLEKILNAEK